MFRGRNELPAICYGRHLLVGPLVQVTGGLSGLTYTWTTGRLDDCVSVARRAHCQIQDGLLGRFFFFLWLVILQRTSLVLLGISAVSDKYVGC